MKDSNISKFSSGHSAFGSQIGISSLLYAPSRREAFHRVNLEHLLYLQNRNQNQISDILLSATSSNLSSQKTISKNLQAVHQDVRTKLNEMTNGVTTLQAIIWRIQRFSGKASIQQIIH